MDLKELAAMDPEAMQALGLEAIESEITNIQQMRDGLFELSLRLHRVRDGLMEHRDARLKLSKMTPGERAAAAVILTPKSIDASKVN